MSQPESPRVTMSNLTAPPAASAAPASPRPANDHANEPSGDSPYRDILLDHLDHFAGHLNPEHALYNQEGTDTSQKYPLAGPSWSTVEIERFHRALSRHSRLRPDLIASEVRTKTVVQVCVYLKALDDGLAKVEAAEARIGRPRPPAPSSPPLDPRISSKRKRVDDQHLSEAQERHASNHEVEDAQQRQVLLSRRYRRIPAAIEMTEDWVQFEEQEAQTLSKSAVRAEMRMVSSSITTPINTSAERSFDISRRETLPHQLNGIGESRSPTLAAQHDFSNAERRAAALYLSSLPVSYDDQVASTMLFLRYNTSLAPKVLRHHANLSLEASNANGTISVTFFPWRQVDETLTPFSPAWTKFVSFCQDHFGAPMPMAAEPRARLIWRAIELGFLTAMTPSTPVPPIEANELPTQFTVYQPPDTFPEAIPKSVRTDILADDTNEQLFLCWTDCLDLSSASAEIRQHSLMEWQRRVQRAELTFAQSRSKTFRRVLTSMDAEDLRILSRHWKPMQNIQSQATGESMAIPIGSPLASLNAATDDSTTLKRAHDARVVIKGHDLGLDVSSLSPGEVRSFKQRVRAYCAKYGISVTQERFASLYPDGKVAPEQKTAWKRTKSTQPDTEDPGRVVHSEPCDKPDSRSTEQRDDSEIPLEESGKRFLRHFVEQCSYKAADPDGQSEEAPFDPAAPDSQILDVFSLFNLDTVRHRLRQDADLAEKHGYEQDRPASGLSVSFQTLVALTAHLRCFIVEVMLGLMNVLEPHTLHTDHSRPAFPDVSADLVRAVVARAGLPAFDPQERLSTFLSRLPDGGAMGDDDTAAKRVLRDEIMAKRLRLDPPAIFYSLSEEEEMGSFIEAEAANHSLQTLDGFHEPGAPTSADHITSESGAAGCVGPQVQLAAEERNGADSDEDEDEDEMEETVWAAIDADDGKDSQVEIARLWALMGSASATRP